MPVKCQKMPEKMPGENARRKCQEKMPEMPGNAREMPKCQDRHSIMP
jgi:hypothetical protein